MARAAGDSSFYTFTLNNRPEVTIELPSVTSIIKAVMSPAFGGAAYWGAKLAVEWAQVSKTNDDPEADSWYEEFKKSDWAPNKVRDKAGARGTKAHEYLEELANSPWEKWEDGRITSSARDPKNGYEEAVVSWFNDAIREGGHSVQACEIPVYSLKHAYAGTVDLVLADDIGLTFVDLKTHKGPARFEDHLQVAAYQLAYFEMHPDSLGPINADQLVVLAREDGTYEENHQYVDPRAFVKVREVYEEVTRYGRSDRA